jgi:hypothetical protein
LSEEREPIDSAGGDAEDDGILDDLLGIEPDEPEDTPEDQEPGQLGDQEVPPAQPSRASRRVSALRNRLKDQESENQRLRSDIERIIAQTRQPAAPQIDPYRQAEIQRQENERLAMMQPHEIAAYTEQKLRNEFQGQRLQDRIELRDLIDKQMFDGLKARNKLAQRFGPQVEELLVAARNQNMNPTREILLKALVGQEVMEKADRQAADLRRRGARQIAAQTTQPGGGRSTVGNGGRRAVREEDSDEAFERRLRNTTLGDAW